jgi:non-canonical (house-cleaning) NTP pyrophosphatase
MAPSIMKQLHAGRELAEVIDEMTGQSDVRSSSGMMGVITNGLLPRADCYAHGIIFAFSPFVADPAFFR